MGTLSLLAIAKSEEGTFGPFLMDLVLANGVGSSDSRTKPLLTSRSTSGRQLSHYSIERIMAALIIL
jgi:hypothetical protein